MKSATPPRVFMLRWPVTRAAFLEEVSPIFLAVALLLVGLSYTTSHAQVRQRAMPPTARASLQEVQATVAIPQGQPRFEAKSLAAADVMGTLLPYDESTPVAVSLDVLARAEWTKLDEGGDVARLRLDAPGAEALHLVFDDFWMPKGAQLFVYNEDRSFVRGAFTSENNKPNGGFAIDFVPGETLILEYFAPRATAAAGRLHLSSVVRSTLPDTWNSAWKTSDATATYTPTALSCSINTSCDEASEWADATRATVMVVRPNGAACSGVLLNNTAEDGKAYVLTANHCGNPTPGATYEKWIVRFDYESASCENPTDVPHYHAATGVHVRVASTNGDFALLELMEPIPAEANVTLAGWSRSSTAPSSVAAIGHPAKDLKKIAFSSTPPQNYVNIYWRAKFDRGCIQDGSSGSPLFDGDNHRVIGFVRASASMSNQCDGPGGDDNQADIWNGTMSQIWNVKVNGVTVSDYLDPLGLDPQSLDGMTYEGEKEAPSIWISEIDAVAQNTKKQFIELEGTAGATFEDLSVDVYACWDTWVYLRGTVNLPAFTLPDDADGKGFYVLAGKKLKGPDVDYNWPYADLMPTISGVVILRTADGTELFDYHYGAEGHCDVDRTNRSQPDLRATTMGFTEINLPDETTLGANALSSTIGAPNPTLSARMDETPAPVKDEVLVARSEAPVEEAALRLAPAAPNPFNPTTTFAVELVQQQNVQVAVYNLLGQRVALLHEGHLPTGSHRFRFDAERLPSGVYLIQAVGEGLTVRQTVTLVK